jgi:SAM-dependent methyltransferase
VLDVACGTGYGSAVLADAGAESVIGIDLSPEAVAHARMHHARSSTDFRADDAQVLRSVPDASVELIASFETLEHVPNASALVAALARVLVPGGTLLISTPNRRLGRIKDQLSKRPSNPHHVYEFTRGELVRLMKPKFRVEKILGQNFIAPPLAFFPVQAVGKTLLALLKLRNLQNRIYYAGSGPAVRRATPFSTPRYLIAHCTRLRD